MKVTATPDGGDIKFVIKSWKEMLNYKLLVYSVFGKFNDMYVDEVNRAYELKDVPNGAEKLLKVDGEKLSEIRGSPTWTAGEEIAVVGSDISAYSDAIDCMGSQFIKELTSKTKSIEDTFRGVPDRRKLSGEVFGGVRIYVTNTGRDYMAVRLYSYGSEFNKVLCRLRGDVESEFLRED
eukprot:scaffold8028_cov81-Cylindrotheca_fusiformis.AAC.2